MFAVITTKHSQDHLRPTPVCYNAVTDTHARVGPAERAEAVLNQMIKWARWNVGDDTDGLTARPNARSYNVAILAWKNSNTCNMGQTNAGGQYDWQHTERMLNEL